MKKIWKSEKTSNAKFTMFVALGAAIAATVVYVFLPSSTGNEMYALEVGFAYGFCSALFALHLLPALITEHRTSRELISRGYSLAADQNVSVSFNSNGTLHEVFYKDASYKSVEQKKQDFQIFSRPAYENPQFHTIYFPRVPSDSFAIVTERLSSGQIVSTVYDCNA